MSPNGTRYPKTPENEKTIQTMHELKTMLSNKKPTSMIPDANSDANNDAKTDAPDTDAKIQDAENDAKIQRDAMDWYHARQTDLMQQVQMMERLIEDKEERHQQEIQEERELRNEDARTSALREKSNSNETLREKERLLDLKERELKIAERELQISKAAAKTDPDSDSDSDSAAMIFCSGNISDAETDVLLDLADMLELERGLRNERFQIATITSLFEYYVSRSTSLTEHLDAVKSGYSVEWALNRFLREFTALVKVRKSATLQVIKVLCLSKISDSLKTKVKSAVKYAGSVSFDVLKNSNASENDGMIPATDSIHDLKTLRELPGMIQLLDPQTSKASRCEHWEEIGKFICEVACYVSDRKQRLLAAKQVLEEFVGTSYVDFDLFVAEFERRFNICTSWFKKPIETDFDKIQRVLVQCPQVVKLKYSDHVTDSKNTIDEFMISWTEFRSLLQLLWKSAFDGVQLQRSLGITHDITQISYSGAAAGNFTAQSPTSMRPPPLSNEQVFQDKNISCIVCETDFLFSSAQQEGYKKKGLEHDPKRCPKCRGQVCDLFTSTGNCPYGSDCKFLHPDSGTDAPATSEEQAYKRKPKYPCRFFEAGRCMKGADCPFVHATAEDNANSEE